MSDPLTGRAALAVDRQAETCGRELVGIRPGGSRTPNSPAVVQPSVPAGLRRGLGAATPCIARRGERQTAIAST